MGEAKTVRLASWKEEEGRVRQRHLEQLGFDVVFEAADAGTLLRTLVGERPGSVVIDLDRSPAQGRDLGVALRVQASTRRIPLIFAGGAPDKVEAVRKILPDAAFGPWEEIGRIIQGAMRAPPTEPMVPESVLAGYSGTPLLKKLGIKPFSRVLLVRGPAHFSSTLGDLPDGARLVGRYNPRVDLILWFVRSRKELERDIKVWAGRVTKGGIWILWPKKSSGVESDLHQNLVRQTGLATGLVDYKVAAIDETWSGLKFSVRKKAKGG